jgi:hypothetical protein
MRPYQLYACAYVKKWMLSSARLAITLLTILLSGCSATIPYQEPQGDNVARLDMPARENGWVKHKAFYGEHVTFGDFEDDGCVYQAYSINAKKGTRDARNVRVPSKTLITFSAFIGNSSCNVIGQIDVTSPGAVYKVETHTESAGCRMVVREINDDAEIIVPINRDIEVFTGWSSVQYCLEGQKPNKNRNSEGEEQL